MVEEAEVATEVAEEASAVAVAETEVAEEEEASVVVVVTEAAPEEDTEEIPYF